MTIMYLQLLLKCNYMKLEDIKMEETTYKVPNEQANTKFCKHCGQQIPNDAVLCTHCGRQVEELKGNNSEQPQIVINSSNTNSNVNQNTNVNGFVGGKPKNKWVALLLCIFLGYFGGHKFYEGKVGMGILYIFTFGLCGIGILIDFIIILTKPNPYYV